MYKIFPHILFLTFSAFFMGCTSVESTEFKEVTLEDRNENGEIVVTEEELRPKQILTSKGSKIDPNVTLNDKSEIVTMYDGYGNKTETRYFKGHTRVQLVVIRSGTDKTKQIFVYGFDKETVQMEDKLSELALTGSGDEIADAAGLKMTRPFKSSALFANPTPIPSNTETENPPSESLTQTQQLETVTPNTPVNESRNTLGETEQFAKENEKLLTEVEKTSTEKQNFQLNSRNNKKLPKKLNSPR